MFSQKKEIKESKHTLIFAKTQNSFSILEKEILIELQYLPSIHYVSKLLGASKVWIEQHENYTKGSYRNRCHLANSQGLLRLSIPLLGGKHQQQSIRDVTISNTENWQSQHWIAIQSAYGKSPFFEFYADLIRPFYQKKYKFLWDWNWDLLQQIFSMIPIEKQLHLSQEYQKNLPDGIADFRNKISPKKHKTISDSSFLQEKYIQVFEEKNGFIPNLSILDLLFCTGPESIIYLENGIQPS